MSRILKLPPLPSLSEVIALYQISAAKRLSQNFILDMKLNRKIVRLAGKLDGCVVVEVGPGPGGITRAILEKNIQHLHVVEKDERFIPSLKTLGARSQKMTTYHGDCLRFPMDKLFPEEFSHAWDGKMPKLHIIGNLPFNVSLPLLVNYLKAISSRTDAWRYGRTPMTLTFQDEIGKRMCSRPNSPHRGRLSFDVQNLCHVKVMNVMKGSSFVPPPDVDVALVRLIPRQQPLVDLPYKVTSKLTCQLFHYRRKYIKAPLSTLFPNNRQELTDELLCESELDPTRCSTELTNEEIARLCVAYGKICDRLPYILHYSHRCQKSKDHSEIVRKVEDELNFVDGPSEYYKENANRVTFMPAEDTDSLIDKESIVNYEIMDQELELVKKELKSFTSDQEQHNHPVTVRLLNDEE